MQLVIGNKNYSSWSMRPWVLMRQLGLHFEEVKLRFDDSKRSGFAHAAAHYNPAGLVPVLLDDDFAVWDSLAICEYLNDKFPGHGVWPEDMRERARARSLAAEMHAGFRALRSHCPMNIEASLAEAGARVWAEHEAVRDDVARIEVMWVEALLASGGPFLFGEFGAADAMYAPVCMRMLTYALPAPAATRSYIERVAASAGVSAWIADARAEHDFLDLAEPYRRAP
jgi:glutathione S-transferase